MADKRKGSELTELFPDCTQTQLDEIGRFSTRTEVDTGTVLCREGEAARTFFMIIKGTAAVEVDGEEVATLGPGMGFGEVALLRGGKRTATVTATTPMTLLVFSRAEFDALVADVPALARDVLHASMARVQEAAPHLTATL